MTTARDFARGVNPHHPAVDTRQSQLAPVRPKWEHEQEQARLLANSYSLATLQAAVRIAQMNPDNQTFKRD